MQKSGVAPRQTGAALAVRSTSSTLSVLAQDTDTPSRPKVCYNRYAALPPMVSPLTWEEVYECPTVPSAFTSADRYYLAGDLYSSIRPGGRERHTGTSGV